MSGASDESRLLWARPLGWALFVASLCLAVGAIVMASYDPRGGELAREMRHFTLGILLIFALPFGFVGAVVASRRPSNPLGWIFLAVGLLQATNVFAGAYAFYGLVWFPGSLPAAEFAQVLWSPTWFPALALTATLALLLFPDGRPHTPRWRWVVRTQVAAFTVMVPAWTLSAWSVRGQVVEDEFGVRPAEAATGSIWEAMVGGAMAVTGVVALLSVVSVVLRFKRAHGIERQQMKWFAFAGALLVIGLLGVFLLGTLHDLGVVRVPGWVEAALVATVAGLPVAAGVAILRYRLFEIDRIVRRTAAYALLTVLLIATYAGLVLVLQPVLRTVTSGSDLAVAASTLAVAALFGPMRRRIQTAVDRRFDRSHYDAARTIEGFAQRLRDQVELDALVTDLTAVAAESVRPRGASVWLAGPHRGAGTT